MASIVEEVCVRTDNTSTSNGSSSYYVSLEDIQDVFPDALRFKLNGHPIPFLTELDGTRIQPPRIAYYDEILDVIAGAPQSGNQTSRDLLLSSSSLVQSLNSSLIARNFEQAEMIKSDPALNQDIQKIKDLLLEAKDKDDKMLTLQQDMLHCNWRLKRRMK
ncbi:hypothetical protein BGX26_005650 [Mortierella sp. AD094]|nr:hypothetical protein BGX26_005650 [Mortierella sp. AD094]